MGKLFCKNCNKDVDVVNDHENGSIVCTICFVILEQNQMVSDMTFVDTGGRKGVIGEIVNNRGSADFYTAGRELLISTVRETMRSFAEQVNIRDSDTLDFGIRVYKLGLEKKFVRGRPRDISVAVSLYIACRMQERPVMLIDFSELLRRDVFLLSHTYYQMVKLLQLNLPLIEPELYLERFASQLDYGSKFGDVVRTAAKLVGRMNRDWLVQGRRPAGISAAALIVSSRMHGFMRTTEDVMTVVRMSAATLQKRLDEFILSHAAKLTPEQFEVKAEMVKEELDPPIYKDKARGYFPVDYVKREEGDNEKALSEEGVNTGKSSDSIDQNDEGKVNGDAKSNSQQQGQENSDGEEGDSKANVLNRSDGFISEDVIEINDEDVQEVNELFDNDEIQELEEEYREDKTNPFLNRRFILAIRPAVAGWVFEEEEVAEDNIPTDEETEKMIADDEEYETRRTIWNFHFGNLEKEIIRKRRERDMLSESRATKRRKGDDEETKPWDAETAEESTRDMLQRISSRTGRSELFDGDIDFKQKPKGDLDTFDFDD